MGGYEEYNSMFEMTGGNPYLTSGGGSDSESGSDSDSDSEYGQGGGGDEEIPVDILTDIGDDDKLLNYFVFLLDPIKRAKIRNEDEEKFKDINIPSSRLLREGELLNGLLPTELTTEQSNLISNNKSMIYNKAKLIPKLRQQFKDVLDKFKEKGLTKDKLVELYDADNAYLTSGEYESTYKCSDDTSGSVKPLSIDNLKNGRFLCDAMYNYNTDSAPRSKGYRCCVKSTRAILKRAINVSMATTRMCALAFVAKKSVIEQANKNIIAAKSSNNFGTFNDIQTAQLNEFLGIALNNEARTEIVTLLTNNDDRANCNNFVGHTQSGGRSIMFGGKTKGSNISKCISLETKILLKGEYEVELHKIKAKKISYDEMNCEIETLNSDYKDKIQLFCSNCNVDKEDINKCEKIVLNKIKSDSVFASKIIVNKISRGKTQSGGGPPDLNNAKDMTLYIASLQTLSTNIIETFDDVLKYFDDELFQEHINRHVQYPSYLPSDRVIKLLITYLNSEGAFGFRLKKVAPSQFGLRTETLVINPADLEDDATPFEYNQLKKYINYAIRETNVEKQLHEKRTNIQTFFNELFKIITDFNKNENHNIMPELIEFKKKWVHNKDFDKDIQYLEHGWLETNLFHSGIKMDLDWMKAGLEKKWSTYYEIVEDYKRPIEPFEKMHQMPDAEDLWAVRNKSFGYFQRDMRQETDALKAASDATINAEYKDIVTLHIELGRAYETANHILVPIRTILNSLENINSRLNEQSDKMSFSKNGLNRVINLSVEQIDELQQNTNQSPSKIAWGAQAITGVISGAAGQAAEGIGSYVSWAAGKEPPVGTNKKVINSKEWFKLQLMRTILFRYHVKVQSNTGVLNLTTFNKVILDNNDKIEDFLSRDTENSVKVTDDIISPLIDDIISADIAKMLTGTPVLRNPNDQRAKEQAIASKKESERQQSNAKSGMSNKDVLAKVDAAATIAANVIVANTKGGAGGEDEGEGEGEDGKENRIKKTLIKLLRDHAEIQNTTTLSVITNYRATKEKQEEIGKKWEEEIKTSLIGTEFAPAVPFFNTIFTSKSNPYVSVIGEYMESFNSCSAAHLPTKLAELKFYYDTDKGIDRSAIPNDLQVLFAHYEGDRVFEKALIARTEKSKRDTINLYGDVGQGALRARNMIINLLSDKSFQHTLTGKLSVQFNEKLIIHVGLMMKFSQGTIDQAKLDLILKRGALQTYYERTKDLANLGWQAMKEGLNTTNDMIQVILLYLASHPTVMKVVLKGFNALQRDVCNRFRLKMGKWTSGKGFGEMGGLTGKISNAIGLGNLGGVDASHTYGKGNLGKTAQSEFLTQYKEQYVKASVFLKKPAIIEEMAKDQKNYESIVKMFGSSSNDIFSRTSFEDKSKQQNLLDDAAAKEGTDADAAAKEDASKEDASKEVKSKGDEINAIKAASAMNKIRLFVEAYDTIRQAEKGLDINSIESYRYNKYKKDQSSVRLTMLAIFASLFTGNPKILTTIKGVQAYIESIPLFGTFFGAMITAAALCSDELMEELTSVTTLEKVGAEWMETFMNGVECLKPIQIQQNLTIELTPRSHQRYQAVYPRTLSKEDRYEYINAHPDLYGEGKEHTWMLIDDICKYRAAAYTTSQNYNIEEEKDIQAKIAILEKKAKEEAERLAKIAAENAADKAAKEAAEKAKRIEKGEADFKRWYLDLIKKKKAFSQDDIDGYRNHFNLSSWKDFAQDDPVAFERDFVFSPSSDEKELSNTWGKVATAVVSNAQASSLTRKFLYTAVAAAVGGPASAAAVAAALTTRPDGNGIKGENGLVGGMPELVDNLLAFGKGLVKNGFPIGVDREGNLCFQARDVSEADVIGFIALDLIQSKNVRAETGQVGDAMIPDVAVADHSVDTEILYQQYIQGKADELVAKWTKLNSENKKYKEVWLHTEPHGQTYKSYGQTYKSDGQTPIVQGLQDEKKRQEDLDQATTIRNAARRRTEGTTPSLRGSTPNIDDHWKDGEMAWKAGGPCSRQSVLVDSTDVAKEKKRFTFKFCKIYTTHNGEQSAVPRNTIAESLAAGTSMFGLATNPAHQAVYLSGQLIGYFHEETGQKVSNAPILGYKWMYSTAEGIGGKVLDTLNGVTIEDTKNEFQKLLDANGASTPETDPSKGALNIDDQTYDVNGYPISNERLQAPKALNQKIVIGQNKQSLNPVNMASPPIGQSLERGTRTDATRHNVERVKPIVTIKDKKWENNYLSDAERQQRDKKDKELIGGGGDPVSETHTNPDEGGRGKSTSRNITLKKKRRGKKVSKTWKRKKVKKIRCIKN